MIDPAEARSHFPSLKREVDGRPALYFDNPAGTQVPTACINGFVDYFTASNANTGGAFVTSEETGHVIEAARNAMADFLHAPSPEAIVFGPNMTSLTFAVSRAFGDLLEPGDEIVLSRLDHDANVAPWLALQQRGAVIRWIDINPDTSLNLESAQEIIGPRTRLVAVGLASNAFGTVNDVARLAALAHAQDALLYVDAVHYGPHGPIDVQALGADLLVCSAYKFFGPHLGILTGRPEVLERLPAYHVRPAGNQTPGKWETGTGNFEALAGLLGTISYLRSLSPDQSLRDAMERIHAYEQTLTARLIPGLTQIAGVQVFGITDPDRFACRVPTASFLVGDLEPVAVARALGAQGIFSWAGNHYAVEPLARLNLAATNRIGLAHYNTAEEVDRFLEAVETIANA